MLLDEYDREHFVLVVSWIGNVLRRVLFLYPFDLPFLVLLFVLEQSMQ